MDWRGWKASPLTGLSDLGTGPKVLFAFQHWCHRGCHLHGFPDASKGCMVQLSAKGVGFAVIQTVFEARDENTFEKLRVNQLRYALPVAFGQDEATCWRDASHLHMEDTARRERLVLSVDAGGASYSPDFHLDADQLVKGLELV